MVLLEARNQHRSASTVPTVARSASSARRARTATVQFSRSRSGTLGCHPRGPIGLLPLLFQKVAGPYGSGESDADKPPQKALSRMVASLSRDPNLSWKGTSATGSFTPWAQRDPTIKLLDGATRDFLASWI